jgi:1,4-alpha-glucan branching enzyme
MKNNRKHKSNGDGHGTQLVRVEFSHPAASAVAIAGTFNDWSPTATPMAVTGDGRWLKELMLPPGTYEYLFVADGKWLPDPQARHTVPNPFGGVNCLMTVPFANRRSGAQEQLACTKSRERVANARLNHAASE